MNDDSTQQDYWSVPVDDVMLAPGSTPAGLDMASAVERLQRYGRNTVAPERSNCAFMGTSVRSAARQPP